MPEKLRQEPLRDLIIDCTALAWCRHLNALGGARSPAPTPDSRAGILRALCRQWPLSKTAAYGVWRDALFTRFFGPAA